MSGVIVQAFLPCKQSIETATSLTLGEIFDSVTYPSLPGRIEDFSLYARFQSKPLKRHKVGLFITPPGAGTFSAGDPVECESRPDGCSRALLGISDLVVERPGDCVFQLVVDGVAVSEFRIRISVTQDQVKH